MIVSSSFFFHFKVGRIPARRRSVQAQGPTSVEPGRDEDEFEDPGQIGRLAQQSQERARRDQHGRRASGDGTDSFSTASTSDRIEGALRQALAHGHGLHAEAREMVSR